MKVTPTNPATREFQQERHERESLWRDLVEHKVRRGRKPLLEAMNEASEEIFA